MSADPARDAVVYAIKLSNELGKMVSFDVNYRSIIWKYKEEAIAEVKRILPYVDLLKISEEELDFVGGEDNVLSTMGEYGITVVIETCGADGARYFFNGKSGEVKGRKVKTVDATGAGDIYKIRNIVLQERYCNNFSLVKKESICIGSFLFY